MSESYRQKFRIEDRGYIEKAWPKLNILWLCNVGDYQGTNYVIGYVDGKVLACGYGYGSCSGCGAWGEGGEPTKPEDLIDAGVFGKTLEETLAWADKEPTDDYQCLTKSNQAEMKAEIRRAFALVEKP